MSMVWGCLGVPQIPHYSVGNTECMTGQMSGVGTGLTRQLTKLYLTCSSVLRAILLPVYIVRGHIEYGR